MSDKQIENIGAILMVVLLSIAISYNKYADQIKGAQYMISLFANDCSKQVVAYEYNGAKFFCAPLDELKK